MLHDTYTVVLTAFEPGAGTHGELRERLCEVFGIEAERAEWTLGRLPFEVVTGAAPELAERYHHALRALGATVQLRPDANTDANPDASPNVNPAVDAHLMRAAAPTGPTADVPTTASLSELAPLLEPLAADPSAHPPPPAVNAFDDGGDGLQLVGNDVQTDGDLAHLELTPLAVSDPPDMSLTVDPIAAGVAPHAIGPRALSARAPANVQRGTSAEPPEANRRPSLATFGKRGKRSDSFLMFDLARAAKLLVLAAAWVVAWLLMRDERISVESEVGTHAFPYVHHLSESANSDSELPLIIGLHGNGDTPDNYYESLFEDFEQPARFVLFRAPQDDQGLFSGTAWPGNARAIARYGKRLARAIQLLEEKYATRCKPIVTGFSGGAHMAYYLAANHADDFAMIVPVAGQLYADLVPKQRPWKEGGAPVRIFHGTRDTTVSYRAGQEATETLLKLGLDTSLQPLEGGHQAIFGVGRYRLLEQLQHATTECE
ncbi:MAG: hypothetical protein OXU20_29720 [Myxococcales bacterium]|nr:hypothetical protein [Myxococcales bacterium]MDD9972196.1 hypothetical protein [Myxococcales bacterium]